MSSTFSSWTRERSANGYARRTSSCSSSTAISSSAQIATICCASTSSGLRGISVSSISPSRIARATTARLEQVGAELREDAALRDGVAARARRGRSRCRPRATDFGDSTWITRSTAPMSMPSSSDEVATRHGIAARLQSSSIVDALLARERAVVGARELALGELVQPQREPLGEAAVVDEDDRRAVRLDEPEDLRVDRRPDRRLTGSVPGVHLLPVGEHRVRERRGRARARACPRPARRPRGRAPCACRRRRARSAGRPRRSGRSPRAAAASPRGRCAGTARPMSRSSRSTREREMRAALRAGDGVHLVEDQRLDAAERLARLRGEQQEERLGRRDQDVRRLLDASARRSFCGVSPVRTPTRSSELEPGERPAQVALDVVVQRLERRDVEQRAAPPPASRSAGRSRRGTRRASCPSRSAPGSGRARRTRSPASRAPARASARRTRARTRPASRARRRRARPSAPAYRRGAREQVFEEDSAGATAGIPAGPMARPATHASATTTASLIPARDAPAARSPVVVCDNFICMAKLLSVSIPDELMRDAEAIARAQGKTKSEVVRDALRRHVRLERLDELQHYGRRRAEERGDRAGGRRGARQQASRRAGLTPRVVIDTNVAVSALIAHGPPARLLEEAIDGHIELLVPEIVLDELDRVLREKLGFNNEHAACRLATPAHRAGGSSASLSGPVPRRHRRPR